MTAADATLLATLAPYGAILILLIVATAIAAAILVLTHLIGTYRQGAVKHAPYESGVPLVGDARRRFNIRFYIVAMLFLLFDVEVVFLWPWAVVFYDAAVNGTPIGELGAGRGFLLGSIAVFGLMLVVGYLYEWRKGAFRWD